ncbi:MAG: peptidase M42, partial [Alicyclobacillus sp.]|nr:peptidase M42 [Alicyclobacillus sp.]
DSGESARSQLRIGTSGVVLEPVQMLGEHRMAGRALDNRVGCAIAIHAFKEAAREGHNLSLVFTAQQAVGARGARTAAFRLQPDLALVIDAAAAGDMPEASRMALNLGAGPALKVLDATAIVAKDVKDLLLGAAEEAGVNVQYEVWPNGLTDAGAVQLSAAGVRIGGISYPARYVGGPSTMVDLRDVEAALTWIQTVIRKTGSQVD